MRVRGARQGAAPGAGEPAVHTDPSAAYLPIADHGVIGNGATVALVGIEGTIDWCCLPHLDSPSVFGALLDARRGGVFRVAPTRGAPVGQRYVPDTNVLLTEFATEGARVTVTDCMPIVGALPSRGAPETAPQIVRLVRCLGGAAEVEVTWAPRPDYARAVADVTLAADRALVRVAIAPATRAERAPGAAAAPPAAAVAGGLAWAVLRGSTEVGRADAERVVRDLRVDDDGHGPVLRARLCLAGDDVVALTTWWGSDAPRWPATEALALERATIAAWRGWVAAREEAECAACFGGAWQALVDRSALVLKLLAFAETGAIAAAATTSLPEHVGGVRNWDYRYAWVRDASFTAQALAAVGHRDEALAFLEWMEGTSMREHARAREVGDAAPALRVMYPLHPGGSLDERVLAHLEGYLGSRPVRIGNGAAGQFQLDVYGELLAAADQITRLGGTVPDPLWRFLVRVADECCARWREPDEGIWEVRGPPQHFVHSKLMAWLALDRALAMARRGPGAPIDAATRARWGTERDALRAAILAHGYDHDVGAFVQAFGSRELDAAALVVPMIGFLPGTDPRVLGTIDRVAERLVVHGFVERYDTRRTDDGLPPGEGAFGLTTCWLVDALALAGRVDEAHAYLERLAGCANHVGLFAEQVDPQTRAHLGNFPQAFTHLGLVNSVLYVAAAERRRTAGPPPLGTRVDDAA